jgi:hypothetical protein
MKSEITALLILIVIVSVVYYFTLLEKEINSESINLILRIIVTIYFMYFVRDIAVSLGTIAKRKK